MIMIDVEKFKELLDKLEKTPTSDYWIDCYYKGVNAGIIYGDGDLYKIEVENRWDGVLVHTTTIGMLVDEAYIGSI